MWSWAHWRLQAVPQPGWWVTMAGGAGNEGFGTENPAEEASETPAQEAAEDAVQTADRVFQNTETPEHVHALMSQAHADRYAREEHGRAAIQAGPGGSGTVDAQAPAEPAPLHLAPAGHEE